MKTTLVILTLIVFLDLLGFGILIPIVPFLLTSPNSTFYLLPAGTPLSEGYFLLGLLVAVYPLMGFLAGPVLGQLSDKYGRRKMLGISISGTLLGYLVFAFGIVTHSIILLFIGRIIDGITGSNLSVARAAVSDITEPDDRAKNYGLLNAGYGLGFILGPFIGGVLSSSSIVSWFNAATPFYFAALLSFIELLLVIYVLPETLKEKVKTTAINLSQSVKNIIHTFTHKNLRGILGTVFLYQAGFAFFFAFQAVFYIGRFGFNQLDVGLLFVYIGICFGINQAFMIKKADTKKEYNLLWYGLIGTGAMVILQVLPTAPWQLLFIIPVAVYFNGIPQAHLVSYISRHANKRIQGQIMGINSSVSALALTIAPIISGYISGISSVQVACITGGVIIIFAGVLFWKTCKSVRLATLN